MHHKTVLITHYDLSGLTNKVRLYEQSESQSEHCTQAEPLSLPFSGRFSFMLFKKEPMKIIAYLVPFLILLLPINGFTRMFGPSNYWECILNEMPGVKNDPAAIEVIRKCRKEFPTTAEVEKKSPIIGIKTAGECVLEYAKDVSSSRGAQLIRAACYRLYPKE